MIVKVCFMSKTKLNCHDQFDRVWFVMKTKKDNYAADLIGAVIVKIGTKLPRSIEQDVVYYEN